MSRNEAEEKIKAQNEPYKLEILEGLQADHPVHPCEDWWDLCAGPHVDHTGQLNAKAFELESVAGAYWRGDETKAQLQRIYGTAWETRNSWRSTNVARKKRFAATIAASAKTSTSSPSRMRPGLVWCSGTPAVPACAC